MTPSTPSIGHIHALEFKLDEIFEEGLEARYARHARTNALVHDWVRRTGFDFFAEEGFRTKTLTCVKNNRGIDVSGVCAKAARKTSSGDRSRIRQNPRSNFSPVEHGRRNRGNCFTFAGVPRRLFCSGKLIASSPKLRMPAIEASKLTKIYRTYRKERGLLGRGERSRMAALR